MKVSPIPTMNACVIPSSVQARIIQAPNSRVSLDLPESFKPAARYAGFEHAASGASIVILEQLPLNATGKVDRAAVKAMANQLA